MLIEGSAMIQVSTVMQAMSPSSSHKEGKGIMLNALYCLAELAGCSGCLSKVLDKGVELLSDYKERELKVIHHMPVTASS